MRYDASHKAETRKKVVKAAAAALRAKGPDGVGVADIMAEVGLTHGGFYAHFPSKAALLAAALDEAFGQSRRRYDRMGDGASKAQQLAQFIDAYVSAAHRDRPEGGCPVAALATDIRRQPPEIRASFDEGLRRITARLANLLEVGGPEDREALAVSLFAEMVGVVALSRTFADPDYSDRLLVEARQQITRRAGLVSSSPEPN